MKIGDKVSFLSEVGGGRVAGFQGKDIVLVEDEDGFQVPMPVSQVVVESGQSYDTSRVVEAQQKERQRKQAEPELEPADRPVTFKAPPQERKGGDQLSAYLAFVPINVKQLSTTRFEAFLVNDCNYFLQFAIFSAEGSAWRLRHIDQVEPNTKIFIEEFGREDLNDMGRLAVQMLPFKRDKSFLLKPAVDVQLRIDLVKFYKLHTFKDTDFFEQPALIYTLVENDKVARPLVIDAQQLKANMYGHDEPPQPKKVVKLARKDGDPVVVDLHASELLETTNGMSASDILNYQLDVFRKTMNDYARKRGTKIVFIHGKGEGVLRKALLNELQYKWKNCVWQDASFREYGYGATQVTIRNDK